MERVDNGVQRKGKRSGSRKGGKRGKKGREGEKENIEIIEKKISKICPNINIVMILKV